MNYELLDNTVTINGQQVNFSYSIREAKVIDELLVILLSIPFNDNTTENLYAVTPKGDIAWRVQKPKNKILNPMPYENISVNKQNQIIVTDFYGRGYIINPKNGEIIKELLSK